MVTGGLAQDADGMDGNGGDGAGDFCGRGRGEEQLVVFAAVESEVEGGRV